MVHEDPVGHASADDEYLSTPPDATYEHTDANVWLIVKFLIWLGVSAIAIHAGLGLLYQLMISRALEVDHAYPLAVGQDERLPPAPRLQQFPQQELREFRLDEESLLQRYGWMNREAGVVHIPIEEAMRLTVERGLLQSAAAGAQEPAAASGLMPADSSAGRTLERRR